MDCGGNFPGLLQQRSPFTRRDKATFNQGNGYAMGFVERSISQWYLCCSQLVFTKHTYIQFSQLGLWCTSTQEVSTKVWVLNICPILYCMGCMNGQQGTGTRYDAWLLHFTDGFGEEQLLNWEMTVVLDVQRSEATHTHPSPQIKKLIKYATPLGGNNGCARYCRSLSMQSKFVFL